MSRGGTVPVPGTNVTGGVSPPAGGAVSGPIGKTIGGATVRGCAGAGIAGGGPGRCDACVCCGAGAPAPPCAGRWALRLVVSKRMKGISAVRMAGSQARYHSTPDSVHSTLRRAIAQSQHLTAENPGVMRAEIRNVRRVFAEEVCRGADFPAETCQSWCSSGQALTVSILRPAASPADMSPTTSALSSPSALSVERSTPPSLAPDPIECQCRPDYPVRIVAVEQHDIFREGLRQMLASQPGFIVVGDARS